MLTVGRGQDGEYGPLLLVPLDGLDALPASTVADVAGSGLQELL